MMKFGYARVSSESQNLERQIVALKLDGCQHVYQEKLSGKNLNRPQLTKLLNKIKTNDEVVVLDLDRLGRNNKDITEIMNKINQKGCTFKVLSLPSFDGIKDKNLKSLLNNLIIEVYKYQAESERKKIRERQHQGIEIAKHNGVYKGSKSKYSLNSSNKKNEQIAKQILTMFNSNCGDTYIAKTLGISRKTVYNKRKQFKHTGSI
ncbi:recombinase family protein [Fructobacillus fructosus]|uniref:recombinase family protein n=1 Tax=Fructobacillus fructosus TaxID=1631 RepID=UPI0030C83DA6